MRPLTSPSARIGVLAAVSAGALLAGSLGAASATSAMLSTSTSSTATYTTRLACSAGTGYPAAVLAAHPSLEWRFDEAGLPAPTTVADSSGNAVDGSVAGTGLVFGGAGLIACDVGGSVAMPGTTDGSIATSTPTATSNTFTLLAWVRTASTQGGRVLGMGDAPSGPSPQTDRALLLAPDGRVVLMLDPTAGPVTLVSPGTVNDGKPHLLAATVSAAGATLYVDGAAVASDATATSGAQYTGSGPTLPGFGYWRVGYDSVADVPVALRPLQPQLAGSVDEVAVWGTTALDAATIASFYAQNHW